jgi:cytochrome bd-type quinol oxidase subunit 1
MRIAANLFILLLFIAGVILLQIYLSKKQNKWLGLILPGICLIISILAVLGMATFTSYTTQTIQTVGENGKVVNEIINSARNKNTVDLASIVFSSIVVFLLYNIPTAILLAIYAGCREKKRKNSELEKMNIQDLE